MNKAKGSSSHRSLGQHQDDASERERGKLIIELAQMRIDERAEFYNFTMNRRYGHSAQFGGGHGTALLTMTSMAECKLNK